MAALADQMMVMLLAAEAVARLARVMAERIDGATFAECGERPVHGGEPDALAAAGEGGMDLLGGRVVALGGQRAENREPLAGRPQSVATEQFHGVLLRCRGHVAYDSR